VALLASCDRPAAPSRARVVTIAQSGAADIIGNDSTALQRAAALLRPGDTLSIGPGTYEMDNSLFVPSGVTVEGVRGRTILRKSRGLESPLAEDGDYGESRLAVTDPGKFRPGMGVAVVDDTLNSGWDVSISSITDVDGPTLRITPMTCGITMPNSGMPACAIPFRFSASSTPRMWCSRT
jgi:hypothetical protein